MENSQSIRQILLSGIRLAAVSALLALTVLCWPGRPVVALGLTVPIEMTKISGMEDEHEMPGSPRMENALRMPGSPRMENALRMPGSPGMENALRMSGLSVINRERQRFERRAMYTLLGWGSANMAAGTALMFTDWSDAGLMTLSWGAINAGIAIFALRGQERLDPHDPRPADFLKREQQFQRIVAVNAGLNVSYITAGLLLQHYGNESRTRQFGSAIAIQGAFLLAFDSYLLYRSTRFLGRVTPLLDLASFEGNSTSLLPGVRVSW